MNTSYKPTTLKVYQDARCSFESLTHKQAADATVQDIEAWLRNLQGMGRSASTCRTYLSAMNQITGLKMRPKGLSRKKREKDFLDVAEIKSLLRAVPNNTPLILLAIVCGPKALKWTWAEFFEMHLNIPVSVSRELLAHAERHGIQTISLADYKPDQEENHAALLGKRLFPVTDQEINRLLRRSSRIARLSIEHVNIRLLTHTHKALLEFYGNPDQVAGAIVPLAPLPAQGVRDPRLHDIGRRGLP